LTQQAKCRRAPPKVQQYLSNNNLSYKNIRIGWTPNKGRVGYDKDYLGSTMLLHGRT